MKKKKSFFQCVAVSAVLSSYGDFHFFLLRGRVVPKVKLPQAFSIQDKAMCHILYTTRLSLFTLKLQTNFANQKNCTFLSPSAQQGLNPTSVNFANLSYLMTISMTNLFIITLRGEWSGRMINQTSKMHVSSAQCLLQKTLNISLVCTLRIQGVCHWTPSHF